MPSTPKAAAPPPPPPPATTFKAPLPGPVIVAPHVAPARPEGSFLVQLLIYNGAPFKDHWAYWICDPTKPDVGVMMEAAGDVMNGFRFEINRSFNLADTTNRPWKRVDLQWVDGEFFDEKAMMNDGQHMVDHGPVCPFEASAYKVQAPGKTLNAVDDKVCGILACNH